MTGMKLDTSELDRALGVLPERLHAHAQAGLERAAGEIVDRARPGIPVDTGALAGSATVEPLPDGGAAAVVGAGLPYSFRAAGALAEAARSEDVAAAVGTLRTLRG